MRRLIAGMKPSLLIVGETEIWPNLIVEADSAGVPMTLVNGRISRKSYPRYRLIKPLTAHLLSRFALLLMRTQGDADRIVALGARPDRARAAGNVKYDNLPDELNGSVRDSMVRELGLDGKRRIVVLGSARDGESEIVLEALRQAGDGLRPLLVIAPRHLNLVPQIEQLCSTAGFGFRTLGEGERSAHEETGQLDVIIFAQMGRLLEIYAIADIAIVGGTIRPFGGHNPLEPASQGVATIVGPHVQNIRDDIGYLRSRDAVLVAEPPELSEALRGLMTDDGKRRRMGEAAMNAVTERRGIARKCVDIMEASGLLP
jgi:3-deoxy-D-manno-octulosonic-acid transferase